MKSTKEVQDIINRYDLQGKERNQLIRLLRESNKQYAKELNEEKPDWVLGNKLFDRLPKNATLFFEELCEYTICSKCDTEDIIEVNNNLIDDLSYNNTKGE